MRTVILTPLAERDVHFYLATAQELKKDPQNQVVFLSFFQPGNDLIRKAGYPVYDPYPLRFPALNPQAASKRFDTPPLESLLLHEKLTFGISSSQECFDKYSQRLQACDQLLTQIEKDFPSDVRVLIQELAGFVSPLSLFLVAKKRGWSHYFTEPSFFKGRIHFLLSSLVLEIPRTPPSGAAQKQVAAYLEKAMNSKLVVAAKKDAHHYKDMGLAKVFNWVNLQKILKKNYQKYVRGQKQEFEFFWNHSRRYLQMLVNRYRNGASYTQLAQLPADKKFVYFPFHVQLDFSLTIRSPRWLDQLALIEKALENLPGDTILLAKEHPASIGCLDQQRLDRVLKNPQFRLMHPQINSYDILAKCYGVITINSKVGAEAITQGLPAISYGVAFYTDKGFAESFKDWDSFKSLLQSWSERPDAKNPSTEWIQFLAQVWEDSFATELYDLSPENINHFSNAIESLLHKKSSFAHPSPSL